jgi:predicted N-acyltransferase
MPDVRTEVATRIDDVDPDEWDNLCREYGFVSHRWLRLAEATIMDYEPLYVLARREGCLNAAAVCVVGRQFKHDVLQQRLGWALRLVPLLRCATPFSSNPGLVVASRRGAAQLVPAVLATMRTEAMARRALFVTYGQAAADHDQWVELAAAGFRQYGRQWDMELPITWQSTGDYLASLRGSDRRKVGKLERRGEREGLQVDRLRSPVHHASRLRALIGNVFDHHGTRDIYVPDLVERTDSICRDDFHVIGAWRDGEIVGCAVALRDQDTLLAKWIGLDYSRSRGTSTYRLLIFKIIQLAIELGVRSLSLGPTAADAKADFGAVAHERLSALAVLAPIPTSLVGAAAQLVAGRAAIDPTYSSAREAAAAASPRRGERREKPACPRGAAGGQ